MARSLRLVTIASALLLSALQYGCAGCSDGDKKNDDPDAPVITSVAPASGIVGVSVTIAGTDFGDEGGTLTIGGATVTPSSWADEQIVFTVPAAAYPGPRTVVVTNDVGTSQIDFFVVLPRCLFANDNVALGNTVSGWTIASNGTMTAIAGSPWLTGGGSNDYGGAVNDIKLHAATRRVFAGNVTSVAVYDVDPVDCVLTAVSGSPFELTAPVPASYGSVEVSPDGTRVFFGDLDNALVRVLAVGSSGALTEVTSSPTSVISEAATVDLRSNGETLYVQEESDFFEAFTVEADGTLTSLGASPFSLDTASGISGGFVSAISPTGEHYAIGTGLGAAIYALDATGTPSLVSGSPQEQWSGVPGGLAFSAAGDRFYISVYSSGSVATFDVGASVTEAAGSPFTGLVQATIDLGEISSVQPSGDGMLLFVAIDGGGYVYSLSLDPNGVPVAVVSSSTNLTQTSGLAVTF